MSPPRAAPSLALAAYAETWISGAKVIVLGDALSPLAERLVERGARLVQVYDRDPARVAEASTLSRSRQISFASLDGAGSAARDGVFDFGIVEDLGALPRDGEPLLALRRALGRRGMALIAARNPEVARSLIPAAAKAEPAGAQEPLGYYELFELVSQHFEEVRMLGQTAFVGYAVADFAAAEDSDVRLDTAFLPGGAEEPEWFLALVSTLPVSSEAFSVIQLPLADLPAAPAPGDRQELQQLEQALERAEARIAELEKAEARAAELERARSAPDASREGRDAARVQRLEDSHRRELDALRAELSKREQWLAALESRATTADQRADDAQAELEQLTQRETRAVAQLAQLERQLEEAVRARRALEDAQLALRRQLDELEQGSGATARNFSELERRAITLSTQLDELRAQLSGAERERAELRSQLEAAERERTALREASQESAAELRELEGQLLERGKEVARLERDLEQTERFGRQLIAQLQAAKASAAEGAGPQAELERLARRNAELEADLEAARWTISSLGASVAGEGVSNEASSKEASKEASPRAAGAAPWQDGANEEAHRSAD